ncbi:hypothetical protein BKA81DRAFT_375876 [Phyllosticta paracitricarpa]
MKRSNTACNSTPFPQPNHTGNVPFDTQPKAKPEAHSPVLSLALCLPASVGGNEVIRPSLHFTSQAAEWHAASQYLASSSITNEETDPLALSTDAPNDPTPTAPYHDDEAHANPQRHAVCATPVVACNNPSTRYICTMAPSRPPVASPHHIPSEPASQQVLDVARGLVVSINGWPLAMCTCRLFVIRVTISSTSPFVMRTPSSGE